MWGDDHQRGERGALLRNVSLKLRDLTFYKNKNKLSDHKISS